MNEKRAVKIHTFAECQLDTRRRLLHSRAGQVLPLTTKAFDTLVYLVEHAGEVVSKSTLLRAVWPHVQVEENSVSQCISAVRRALGENPGEHRFIVTVPGRGYRFIAEVSDGLPATTDSLAQSGLVQTTYTGRSLAVLPLKPLSQGCAPDSLGLGMANELIMRIAALPHIEIRPLSSVRRFADVDQDPVDAGRALGVDAVLDGSLQREGDRLRASIRLLDVASGRQLWADRFDERFTDIFTIQDAIVERVAVAILPELTNSEIQRLRRHPTEDTQAFQLYVSGWSALTRPGGGNLEHALQQLQEAVRRDPSFALAHVCVADCSALLAVFGLRAPHDVFPSARAAVLKALELDGDSAEAHAELGHIHAVYDLDWPRAEACYRRALQINPRCAMAQHYMGLLVLAYGKCDEALAYIRRAQSLEPLAANFNANIGLIHYYAGHYRVAIEQLEATLELDASFDHARSYLGRSWLQLGEAERAIEHFQRRTSVTLGSVADLAAAHALSGRVADAERELHELMNSAGHRYVSAYDVATVHAALGHPEPALDWLERAMRERSQPINFVRLDPMFRALRSEARFAEIVKQPLSSIEIQAL